MTTALIALTAAATIAALLFRHARNDLRDQRADLAAENDDLRGEVREVRAERDWARRTIAAVVQHAEDRREQDQAAHADELAAARKRKAARPRAVASK